VLCDLWVFRSLLNLQSYLTKLQELAKSNDNTISHTIGFIFHPQWEFADSMPAIISVIQGHYLFLPHFGKVSD